MTENNDKIVWHGKNDSFGAEKWSNEIIQCFELNEFEYNTDNGRWSKKIASDRSIYFTENGRVNLLGDDFTQRICTLENFYTYSDWNWAVTHLSELTSLKSIEINI